MPHEIPDWFFPGAVLRAFASSDAEVVPLHIWIESIQNARGPSHLGASIRHVHGSIDPAMGGTVAVGPRFFDVSYEHIFQHYGPFAPEFWIWDPIISDAPTGGENAQASAQIASLRGLASGNPPLRWDARAIYPVLPVVQILEAIAAGLLRATSQLLQRSPEGNFIALEQSGPRDSITRINRDALGLPPYIFPHDATRTVRVVSEIPPMLTPLEDGHDDTYPIVSLGSVEAHVVQGVLQYASPARASSLGGFVLAIRAVRSNVVEIEGMLITPSETPPVVRVITAGAHSENYMHLERQSFEILGRPCGEVWNSARAPQTEESAHQDFLAQASLLNNAIAQAQTDPDFSMVHSLSGLPGFIQEASGGFVQIEPILDWAPIVPLQVEPSLPAKPSEGKTSWDHILEKDDDS